MEWLIGTFVVIYVVGVAATFVFHIGMLQMVTPGLAFLRALVWPYFWITGRPHGRRLPMD